MESVLPTFKESNPQLEVVTELIRGQHPHLKAFYSKRYYYQFLIKLLYRLLCHCISVEFIFGCCFFLFTPINLFYFLRALTVFEHENEIVW